MSHSQDYTRKWCTTRLGSYCPKCCGSLKKKLERRLLGNFGKNGPKVWHSGKKWISPFGLAKIINEFVILGSLKTPIMWNKVKQKLLGTIFSEVTLLWNVLYTILLLSADAYYAWADINRYSRGGRTWSGVHPFLVSACGLYITLLLQQQSWCFWFLCVSLSVPYL